MAIAAQSGGDGWLGKARTLRTYVDVHGALPRKSDGMQDGVKVGVFLFNQRRAARGAEGRNIDTDRRAWLDTAVPGWDR